MYGWVVLVYYIYIHVHVYIHIYSTYYICLSHFNCAGRNGNTATCDSYFHGVSACFLVHEGDSNEIMKKQTLLHVHYIQVYCTTLVRTDLLKVISEW